MSASSRTRPRRHSIARRSASSGRTSPTPADSGSTPASSQTTYVKTHCCFCGQQCGMQLKVKDNLVIGVEPWYEFPFNKGMLCPKGVKRYLQQAHPDRLLHAYAKRSRLAGRLPADGLRRRHPARRRRDRSHSSAARHATRSRVLSGASLTTEKTYLMGKFAHMCLRTANIDYNGRLCMVSAGGRQQEGVRHRSRGQPLERHPRRRGDAGSAAPTSPSARRSRPTTSGRPASSGAKVIVVDPRITPIARTCDLFLPVKPGRDTALFNGILHLMIEHDWLDHAFIENHTVGFEAVAAARAANGRRSARPK